VPADFKFCGTCGHRITSANDAVSAGVAPVSGPAAPAGGLAATSPAGSAAATGPQRGVLVLINPDGSEGVSFPLMEGATPVGRSAGKLFASDAYLSPLHATFTVKGDVCTVRDENSLNGVYVKLARDRSVRLANGDIFRIGQEILRFETMPAPKTVDGVELMGSVNPGFIGRICLVIGRDSIGHAHTIPREGIYLGRERGDVIFPEDGYVSGLHCRIQQDADSMALTDIGSSNGTFLRVRGERRVASGELILMGQQLFRLQLQ
jgi:pSer/pThr/pTyr-binding forkhead associated (FHA) protein